MNDSAALSPPTTAGPDLTVRRGSASDADLLVSLFDDSVAWLVSRGFTAQWGSTPFSQVPRQVQRCQRWAANGRMWMCEADGQPVGALVLDDAPAHVPPATEPEVYVLVLVTAHTPAAKGAGAFLLQVAVDQAHQDGADLVRVDCFAGNGGALVRFYESCGFVRSSTFEVDGWPGQVLERRAHPRTHTGPADTRSSSGTRPDVHLCVLLWEHPDRAVEVAAYEEAVLALLPRHGGRLVSRHQVLGRGPGDPLEVQYIEMVDEDALTAYLQDPARAELARIHDRDAIIARTQMIRLDVTGGRPTAPASTQPGLVQPRPARHPHP